MRFGACRKSSWAFGCVAIPRASDGDERVFGAGLDELLPEAADVDLDQVAAAIEVVIPGVFQDLAPGQQAALIEKKVLEDREFLGGHIDLASIHCQCVG